MEDMKQLQTDYLSIPARVLVPLLVNLNTANPLLNKAQDQFKDWDFKLDKNSIAAGIYVAWEEELQNKLLDYFPDPEAEILIDYLQMSRLLEWILNPEK